MHGGGRPAGGGGGGGVDLGIPILLAVALHSRIHPRGRSKPRAKSLHTQLLYLYLYRAASRARRLVPSDQGRGSSSIRCATGVTTLTRATTPTCGAAPTPRRTSCSRSPLPFNVAARARYSELLRADAVAKQLQSGTRKPIVITTIRAGYRMNTVSTRLAPYT
jgi:hypothetical protein